MLSRVLRMTKGAATWDVQTGRIVAAQPIPRSTVLWIEKSLLPTVPMQQPRRGEQGASHYDTHWTALHTLAHLLGGTVRPEALAAVLDLVGLPRLRVPSDQLLDAQEILMMHLYGDNPTAVTRTQQLWARVRVLPTAAVASLPVTPSQLINIRAVLRDDEQAKALDTDHHTVIVCPALFTLSDGAPSACFGADVHNVVCTSFMYKGRLHEAAVSIAPIAKGQPLWKGQLSQHDCHDCGSCGTAYKQKEGKPPSFMMECIAEALALQVVERRIAGVAKSLARHFEGWGDKVAVHGDRDLGAVMEAAQTRMMLAHSVKARYCQQLPRVAALARRWVHDVPVELRAFWGGTATLSRTPTAEQVLQYIHQAEALMEEAVVLREKVRQAAATTPRST